MGMYDVFKTDEVAEREGIIIDYTSFRVTIARAGGANKKYKRMLDQATKPHERLIQLGSFSNEQAEDLLKAVYAKSVIKDWETKVDDKWLVGLENPDGGELLPVTVANILTVFELLPDLYIDLRDQAQKSALYRVALREEAEGNL